jgi:hypothetical protein
VYIQYVKCATADTLTKVLLIAHSRNAVILLTRGNIKMEMKYSGGESRRFSRAAYRKYVAALGIFQQLNLFK